MIDQTVRRMEKRPGRVFQEAVMNSPKRSTYSMWNLFRNCRKAFEWRYIDELVTLRADRNLSLGSTVHAALEQWHRDRDLVAVLDAIDRAYPQRVREPEQKRDWHLASALMKGYAARYWSEEFEVVALEKVFDGPIVNPATGAASRTFTLSGKVDGIVKMGTDHYLLEHKTVSQVSGDYLERLWTDFQIILYSHYVERALGRPVAGIIYNVLVKAKLKQREGETEAEYEARRAALAAKSKTGRSSAKRRLAESDETFQERLANKYAEPEMFHREQIYLSHDRFEELQAQLWELTQSFLEARRRGVYYQNTSYCWNYNRPCAYLPLCRSGGNPNVVENLYQRVPPHEELRPTVRAKGSSDSGALAHTF